MKRIPPWLILLFIAPLLGEIVSGHQPPLELFNPISFLLLMLPYGFGALICRELVRRWKKGWPSLILLAVAYGVYEEAIVIRSFFNPNWIELGNLKPEYAQTWADYFVKYIKAYQAAGIPIWGVTVQNEALATQVWESMIFTANEEKDFVRDYLGPTLKKNGLSDVKIMIWDHNRGLMYQRAQAAYEDPKASQYIWGTAFHWYTGDHFDNVRIVHDAFPDKKLLYTEAGMGGDWNSAIHIAKNMIIDLNNWCTGYTFWNMILDQNGGPRHAGDNGLVTLRSNIITADSNTGEVTFNPPHYTVGQFSRFIKPGAKRIACTSSSDDFIATAFINPDGKVAVVILNLKNTEKLLQLWVEGKVLKLQSPPEAVITVIL